MWTNQDLKKLRPKNNFKNTSKQYPASNFTPCHDWNIFSHSKTIQLVSLKTIFFFYCLGSEIVLLRPEFYLLLPWPAPPLVGDILFLPD